MFLISETALWTLEETRFWTEAWSLVLGGILCKCILLSKIVFFSLQFFVDKCCWIIWVGSTPDVCICQLTWCGTYLPFCVCTCVYYTHVTRTFMYVHTSIHVLHLSFLVNKVFLFCFFLCFAVWSLLYGLQPWELKVSIFAAWPCAIVCIMFLC